MHIREWTFKKVDFLLATIGILTLVEIICIRFRVGFPILSEAFSGVVYDVSLALFSSYVFYFIVVFVPENRNWFYRKKSAYYFVYVLCNCVDSIVEMFVPWGKIDQLDESAWNEKFHEDTFLFWQKYIHRHYGRVVSSSQFIDAKTMLRLDNIVMWLDRIITSPNIDVEGGKARANVSILRHIYKEVVLLRREEAKALALVSERLKSLETEGY